MKKILLYLIRFYRKYLSPMKVYTHCIYIPTCSEYALEAIEKYGAFKGGLLTVWRILRCNPFAKVDMIRCLKPIGRPNTGTEMFMEERL